MQQVIILWTIIYPPVVCILLAYPMFYVCHRFFAHKLRFNWVSLHDPVVTPKLTQKLKPLEELPISVRTRAQETQKTRAYQAEQERNRKYKLGTGQYPAIRLNEQNTEDIDIHEKF